MSTYSLKLIASDKIFYEGRVELLVIPAQDGEKAILGHHENMAIAVTMGSLKIRTASGQKIEAVVGNGFAQIMNNRVTVIVDTAERPEDIDAKRAEEALERAKERLRQNQSYQEYFHSQAALSRAMARLKATSKYI